MFNDYDQLLSLTLTTLICQGLPLLTACVIDSWHSWEPMGGEIVHRSCKCLPRVSPEKPLAGNCMTVAKYQQFHLSDGSWRKMLIKMQWICIVGHQPGATSSRFKDSAYKLYKPYIILMFVNICNVFWYTSHFVSVVHHACHSKGALGIWSKFQNISISEIVLKQVSQESSPRTYKCLCPMYLIHYILPLWWCVVLDIKSRVSSDPKGQLQCWSCLWKLANKLVNLFDWNDGRVTRSLTFGQAVNGSVSCHRCSKSETPYGNEVHKIRTTMALALRSLGSRV